MKRYKREAILSLLIIVSLFIKSSFLFSVSLFFLLYFLLFRFFLLKGIENTKVEMSINNTNIMEGNRIEIRFKVMVFSFLPILEIIPEIPVFFISGKERNLLFSPVFKRNDEFKIELISKRRGKYNLGRIKIRTYDPLGFIRIEKVIDKKREVYVFPRIIKISRPKIPVREPSFGIRVKERIFEDYTSLVGVREYSGKEDLKKIHWKISAHMGKLMVKEFPPTSITSITIIVEPYATDDKRNEEIFLNHISTITASLFNYFEFVKFRYGLWIIGKERIREGNGREHLIKILREIACLKMERKVKFLDFLKDNTAKIRNLKNIIIIKRTMDEDELLEIMRRKNPFTFISILLIPDFGFLFPWEKPHPYQMVEGKEIERIRKVKDNMKKERINIVIIRGNDSIERFAYI